MSCTVPTDDVGSDRRVRDAFDRGARRYNLMVALNPGYHRHLRFAARELVRRIGRGREPRRMLDLACGSGASTRALVNASPTGTQVLGVDLSAGMLEMARHNEWPSTVNFIQAEVGRLDPLALGAQPWDGALAAYLFRNIDPSARDAAVAEVYEVLEPDGWLVIQEYSVAESRRAQMVWNVVSWLVIIPLGTVLDRNPRLYRYLWRSVHAFDSTERFMSRLGTAGFVDVATRTASGWQHGILHTFVARKPAP